MPIPAPAGPTSRRRTRPSAPPLWGLLAGNGPCSPSDASRPNIEPVPNDVILRSLRSSRALLALLTVSTAPWLSACADEGSRGDPDLPDPVERDLAAIQEADTLTALLVFNSTSYFIYRGESMGLEYELLRAFADEHDLELRVDVIPDRAELFRHLNEGAGDVVAARLTPDPDYADHVLYTSAIYRTRPMLVQRGEPPESVDLVEPADTILEAPTDTGEPLPDSLEVRARLVQGPGELGGEEVHIPRHSEFYHHLVTLSDEFGDEIEIVELEAGGSYERLIRMVSRGQVELGVAPENVARLREDYFTNLVVRPTLGPAQPVVWAVRETSPELQAAFERWLEGAQQSGLVDELYRKYFEDRAGYGERVESEYLASETGRLSPYDDLLKEHARELGWDWRLLASQTFQESRFEPRARSWAGAMGLLQLMPGTARDMEVDDPWDPRQNVDGAVRYLRFLEERWEPVLEDPEQRLRFVLASYNAGFGHVEDAQRLAEKNGDDPLRWEDVGYWLLQKSKRPVYTDPVVRYGYARGLEPVTYVALILERFHHYLEFVTDEGPSPPDTAPGRASVRGR